jgi:hypothetical protein
VRSFCAVLGSKWEASAQFCELARSTTIRKPVDNQLFRQNRRQEHPKKEKNG